MDRTYQPGAPLEPITALHTAARQHCQDRHAHWARTSLALEQAGQGGGAALFARYQQLDAIRRAVEAFVPEDFATLPEARALLQAAGDTARPPALPGHASPSAAQAMAEERALFAAAMAGLDLAALSQVAPLPFRRTLNEADARRLVGQLERRFGRWYGGMCSGADVPAYLTFHLPLTPAPTQALLALLPAGTERVIEVTEEGEATELGLGLVEFDGSETFWCTQALDWLVYASHEATLSVAGPALVAAVNAGLPSWLPQLAAAAGGPTLKNEPAHF
jgi:hypothetical protein